MKNVFTGGCMIILKAKFNVSWKFFFPSQAPSPSGSLHLNFLLTNVDYSLWGKQCDIPQIGLFSDFRSLGAFWYPNAAMCWDSLLWLVLKVKWKASNDQDPILVVTFTQNNKDRKSRWRYWTPGWVMGLLYNSIRWKFYRGGLNHE